MTNTQKNILIIVVIAVIVLFIIIFRKSIGKWMGMNNEGSSCNTGGVVGLNGTIKNGMCVPNQIVEGTACTVASSGAAGTIRNGICVPNIPANGTACTVASSGAAGTIQNGICIPNPVPGQISLKVINPDGAYIFSFSQDAGGTKFTNTMNKIPFNTVINVPQIITNSNFTQINTNSWVLTSDIQALGMYVTMRTRRPILI